MRGLLHFDFVGDFSKSATRVEIEGDRAKKKFVVRQYVLTQLMNVVLCNQPPEKVDDEVARLARSLNRMAGQLEERLALLARERNQLRTVLDGMVEGVLLTDATGTILLANGAFARIFAAQQPVGHLILQSPFTSAADVGAQRYWFVPVGLLMKDQFRSDLRIGKVTAPVLVLHGDRDNIVPMALAERLYGLINAPKRFVRFPGIGHNDLGAEAVEAAKQFLGER